MNEYSLYQSENSNKTMITHGNSGKLLSQDMFGDD